MVRPVVTTKPTLPIDNLIYPLAWDIDGISQLTLRYSHWQKKFFKQHLSGILSGFCVLASNDSQLFQHQKGRHLKQYAILIVDADAVLPRSISLMDFCRIAPPSAVLLVAAVQSRITPRRPPSFGAVRHLKKMQDMPLSPSKRRKRKNRMETGMATGRGYGILLTPVRFWQWNQRIRTGCKKNVFNRGVADTLKSITMTEKNDNALCKIHGNKPDVKMNLLCDSRLAVTVRMKKTVHPRRGTAIAVPLLG